MKLLPTLLIVSVFSAFTTLAAEPAAAAPTAATAPTAGQIGCDAPKIEGVDYVKGTFDGTFKPGTVYVVEFWATWCPPCRASIPHLSSLQQKYGDKVVVIGISSEAIDKVKTFIADPKLKMEYVVGVAKTAKMNELYMKAFKQRGIPCAFIVGKDGKIAYVGHPMGMDKDLEKIVRK